jgi:hypothetical protein
MEKKREPVRENRKRDCGIVEYTQTNRSHFSKKKKKKEHPKRNMPTG